MSDPDPDDDAQLRSLRAVWLSLPDEDPPERGMGELLAAARAKATEMARPAWWQRVLDLVRRPGVLALATLTVLIGGAVLIGRHGDQLEPQQAPASQPTSVKPRREPAQSPPVVEPTRESAAPVAKRSLAPSPRPAPTHASPDKASGRLPEGPTSYKLESSPAPDLGRERVFDSKGEASSAKTQRSTAPITSAQCRAAAQRGDCAAALACVARVVGHEREQLGADAAITKCMSAQ